MQIAAVTATTLFWRPFGSGMVETAMAGAVAGVATDVGYNGMRMLNLNRSSHQAGVGAGTALTVGFVAGMVA